MVQKPAALQHAPCSTPHGEGKQVVPTPRKLLAPLHPAPIVSRQLPAPLQHAPSSGAQGVGEGVQDVPAPWKAPLQPSETVIEHEPDEFAGAWLVLVPRQQAPSWAVQGLAPQVVPTPLNVWNDEARQPFAVVVVHAEDPLAQHAPVSAAHGDAPHVVPLPRKVLVPVQPLATVTVHAAEPEQHAPVMQGLGAQSEPTPLNV